MITRPRRGNGGGARLEKASVPLADVGAEDAVMVGERQLDGCFFPPVTLVVEPVGLLVAVRAEGEQQLDFTVMGGATVGPSSLCLKGTREVGGQLGSGEMFSPTEPLDSPEQTEIGIGAEFSDEVTPVTDFQV